MDLQLKNKVVLITGGAKGIGAAITRGCAAEGGVPVIVDLDSASGLALRSELERDGKKAGFVAADLTSAQACSVAIEQTLRDFGRLDVLVNNVGGSAPGDPVSMTEEVWDRQIDFNLKTAFLGCKYALPIMVAQGKGAIVNIASVAGLRNDFSSGRVHVGYAASKAGVIQLSRSTAGAFAKRACGRTPWCPG